MKKILFLLPVLMLLFGSAFAQKQPHDLSIERGLDKSKPWLMLSDTVDSKYRYGKFKCYDWDSLRTDISLEIDDDITVATQSSNTAISNLASTVATNLADSLADVRSDFTPTYYEWVGIVSQVSTNPPTATVLKNTFPVSASYTYTTTGDYKITFSGYSLDSGNSTIEYSPNSTSGGGSTFFHFQISWSSGSARIIARQYDYATSGSATPTNSIMSQVIVRITKWH